MVFSWKDIKNSLGKLKDLTSIGIANLSAMAISSIFWLYMASLIGEEGYGNISYLLATGHIVGNIALLGSSDTLVVFRAKDVKIQSALFLCVIVAAVIASLVTYLFIESTAISIFILGIVVFSLILYETLGSRNYKKYSYFIVSQRILTVFLALTLYFVIGIEGIVLGYALAYLPYVFFSYRTFKDVPIDFQIVRIRLRFIVISYGKSLMATFGSYLDKLIIFPLFGAALLGNYALGYQIFALAAILPGIVFQYVLPQESSGKSHARLKILTVISSAIITLITFFLVPTILPFLFPDFEESVDIIQIMSLALVPSAISIMIISNLLANEKIQKVVIGQAIGLIILIGGIFVLKENFGIIGAAIAFVMSNIIAAVYYYIISKH